MREANPRHDISGHRHRRAVQVSIFVSAILFGLKLPVGLIAGSAAVTASALDSLFDLLTSGGNLLALGTAARPADDNHRFGHGKAEALASFIQSLIIGASALYLAVGASTNYWEQAAGIGGSSRLDAGGLVLGLGVMAISMAGTGLIIFFHTQALKAGQSAIVEVDRLHYLSDFLSALVVIAALVLSHLFNAQWVDVVGAVLVAGYLLYASVRICLGSINVLMDKDISYLYRQSLDRLVDEFDDVLGYHDLKSRSMGQEHHLYFHLEIRHQLSFEKSHRIVEEISQKLKNEHGDRLKIMIHADPAKVAADGKTILLDKERPEFQ